MVNSIYGETQPPKLAIESQDSKLRDFLRQATNPKILNKATRLIDIMITLADKDFIQAHSLAMEQYDFWENKQLPVCTLCHDQILSPRNLIRYIGSNLHPACFRDIYKIERNKITDTNLKKYFDKVFKLI